MKYDGCIAWMRWRCGGVGWEIFNSQVQEGHLYQNEPRAKGSNKYKSSNEVIQQQSGHCNLFTEVLDTFVIVTAHKQVCANQNTQNSMKGRCLSSLWFHDLSNTTTNTSSFTTLHPTGWNKPARWIACLIGETTQKRNAALGWVIELWPALGNWCNKYVSKSKHVYLYVYTYIYTIIISVQWNTPFAACNPFYLTNNWVPMTLCSKNCVLKAKPGRSFSWFG